MIFTPMWTCLACCHLAAFLAVEGMLEPKWGDPDFLRAEPVEYLLRCIRAVVLSHAGMIAADNDVCAPVVLPADGVKIASRGPA